VWLATRFPITYNPQRHLDFEELNPPETDQIHQAVVDLVEANVAVYPVHAPGLVGFTGFTGFGGPSFGGGGGLLLDRDLPMTIADMTGGRMFMNTNGLAGAIAESVEDTRVSYRLGFYPVSADDAELHELEVRVDRPNVRLYYRSGYFGFRAVAKEANAPSMAELLTSALPPTSIGLLAKASLVDNEDSTYEVALSVDLADVALDLHDGFREGRIEVAMLYQETAMENGEVEIRVLPTDSIPIRLTDDGFLRGLETGFTVIRKIVTDGRPGFLRIAVIDPVSGASGSLTVALAAPDSTP
jgi:hypothetical protein